MLVLYWVTNISNQVDGIKNLARTYLWGFEKVHSVQLKNWRVDTVGSSLITCSEPPMENQECKWSNKLRWTTLVHFPRIIYYSFIWVVYITLPWLLSNVTETTKRNHGSKKKKFEVWSLNWVIKDKVLVCNEGHGPPNPRTVSWWRKWWPPAGNKGCDLLVLLVKHMQGTLHNVQDMLWIKYMDRNVWCCWTCTIGSAHDWERSGRASCRMLSIEIIQPHS